MDDPEIDGLNGGRFGRGLSSLLRRFWRSGMVTALIVGLLVVGLGIAYRERGRGHLHKLEQKIVTEREDAPVPRPGGQEALVLSRSNLPGVSVPEFLSVTILPGRGMNILQITAYVPGKGDVDLMASPTVDEATSLMTGQGKDANGRVSLGMGGPFEAPWAGGIWGTPTQSGENVSATWHGHTLMLPITGSAGGEPIALGGRMLASAADSAGTAGMPDGGQAQATFQMGDFGGRWPSDTEVMVTVLLTNRSIELTMTAHNKGDVAEPIGLGWRPRFAIDAGHRDDVKLRVSGQMRAEAKDGLPTGALVPVAGTPYDFTAHEGVRLGKLDLNDTFVRLHQELLDNGPTAELREPENRFGLRLTALSSTIKAMHVMAPAKGDFVTIAPQYNYDDPFGKEWGKDVDTGMVVLQPGQSTQWKVRLELFPLTGNESPN